MGTARGGIAVALHLDAGQEDTLGQTIAHELAHYLGLFHTVEVANAAGNVLKDNLNDTDNSTNNLLHWAVSTGSSELTPDQRFVLLGNPWLYAD